MRPAYLKLAITAALAVQQPVMLWGPPGVGKSALIRQIADILYGPKKGKIPADVDYFIDLRLPLMDPTGADFRFPLIDVKTGTVRWVTSEDFPRTGRGIILLDEIPQAMPIVQAGASSLILDRRIGTYRLPPGWGIVAAGNREGDRAATHKMPSHIANRFVHLNYDVHFEDWVEWALENDIEPAIIGYLSFRPEMLHKFDLASRSFPTPRSWSFVSKLMKQGIPDECFMEMVSGTVGEVAATEFTGFFRVFRSLPDYEDIVKNPTTALVPDNAAALYAVSSMITFRGETKTAKPMFEYMERLPMDFQILIYRNITKKNLEMAETQSYIRWTTKNQALILNR